MDILIYGAGKRCGHLMERLRLYPEVHVSGIADSFLKGEIFGFQVTDLLHDENSDLPKDSIIVITLANPKKAIQVVRDLQNRGYINLYLYLAKTKTFGDFLSGECKKLCWDMGLVLPSIEMHAVDYCNLNCAGCVHFSPLFQHENPIFEDRLQDLNEIRRLFSQVLFLSILGGEPLLSLDINHYMKAARDLFPESELQLITNGLLLPKMDDDFFSCVRSNNITIVISEYKPTSKMMPVIVEQLTKWKIDYSVRGNENKSHFNRSLSVRKDSIHEKYCLSDGCTAVCEGKIARCPTLLYIHAFNNYFHQKLPQAGIYQLQEFKNGDELLKQMEERVPLCDYCVLDDMTWHTCGASIKLEDFASLD